MPFAIVGSNSVVEVSDAGVVKRLRVRKYPWGVVDVENDAHSDFVTLRNCLMR